MWLTRFSLKQPTIVTLFFVAVALFGTIGYVSMGENIIPNVSFPVVVVSAVYPGASPDEMERLVIKPIEDQIQNVRHIDRLRATAKDGTAIVIVFFKLGTNLDSAATDVQQAVDAARANLPSDLNPPIVQKNDPSSEPILEEAVTSTALSPVVLSDVVKNEIVPKLKGVKGVGTVFAGGEYTRQFTVEPDVGRMQAVGATLLDLNNAVGQGNVSLPGGRLDLTFREATVGVRADITNPRQFAALPLTVPGGATQQLHVGDVARIDDGYQDHRIDQTVNARSALVLFVARDSDSDTIKTTAAVRKAFFDLQTRYPKISFSEIGTDATFTKQSINGVLQNLFEGILLTAGVLLFFLHVWRSAVVVMVAIPTSLLATFFVSWVMGFTVDVLSLMGLSLTIGILVDDSIVVIENITRHREMGKPPEEAAIVGRSEIGGAAVAITLVDVVVFAPIAFMSGIIGQYFREFGLVVVVATLFSLLVSFTLTPLLAARWSVLKKPRPSRWRIVRAFGTFFESVRRGYHDRLLPAGLRHPWVVVIGSFALVGLSIVPVALQWVPSEFQPATEWGQAIVGVTYPAGTPIATTEAGVNRLVAECMKMKGVANVVATVGQASNGFTEVLGGHVATIRVVLRDDSRHEEHKIVERVEQLGYLVPGARITAAGAQTGGAPPIAYTLTGPVDALNAAGDKLAAFIASDPRARDVQTSNTGAGPRLEVAVDRDRATALGVSPQAAALTARAAIGGVISTKVRMPAGLIDTLVRLPESTRNDLNVVGALDVRAQNGMLVPLSDVVHFSWTTEPAFLERQDRERIVRVTADTANGAPIGLITNQVQAQLKKPGFLPGGVSVKPIGDTELLGDTFSKIGLALLTSFLLIYMLLVILYRGYLTPLVIMFSVPLALVGALGILFAANVLHRVFPDIRFFTGQSLNLFSMLGVVMLMGLVAKNGILLVDYANTLKARGLSLRDAIRESASIRFRPIVMTTAAMIMGMLPLALGITEGAEFRKSMGTVIIGGLTSSLLLTLFLVPVVYVGIVGFVDRWRQRRLERRMSIVLEDAEPTGTSDGAADLRGVARSAGAVDFGRD